MSLKKKVSTTEKKKVRFKSKPEIIPFDDSGYESLSDEESDKKISNYQEKESIYVTVPKEHIEAKRASKQQQQSKPPIPLKPSIAPLVPNATGQEVRQSQKKAPKSPSVKERVKSFESNTLAANATKKAHASTQVSVKEIIAQFEGNYKRK